jgi:DNA ligase-1
VSCAFSAASPTYACWRQDKPLDEINTLDDLKEMLATYG